jgi:aminopeptidase
MEQQIVQAYAETILTSVALRRGQYLLINCEPINRPFALTIAEEAYRRGAAYVAIEHPSRFGPRLNRMRADLCPEEYLEELPPSLKELAERRIEERWVHISLTGEEEPDVMEGVDPRRSRLLGRGYAPMRDVVLKAKINARVQWQVVYLPTPATAARILGRSRDDEGRDRVFEALAEILMLRDPDPAARWRERTEEIHRRAEELAALDLERLFFTGPGTELSIGLPARARWLGGAFTMEDGTRFLPNLPTEEVFTSPDLRSVEGRVAVTRPVLVKETGNQLVEGAWFEFNEGRVVNYGAEKGRHVLDELLSYDEGARYLGEVALVDGNSQIFKSGLLWRNTLLDENAACHIALGRGISPAIEGGASMSDADLHARGVNTSQIHTDFMIGSPEVDVRGTTSDGREVEIIREGRFRI